MGILYNINCKDLYNISLNKIHKRKIDEYSDEESNNGINIKKNLVPSYDSVKSSIYRYITKSLTKDIENITDLPKESEYYLTG